MKALGILSAAVLLTAPALTWAQNPPETSRLLLTNSGAKPVDCGIGSDYGWLAYIGCGKVAVSLKEFEPRARAELKKQGFLITKEWDKGDLNGMPTRRIVAEKGPYILSVEVRWPAKELPTTIFLLWVKTREATEEERRKLNEGQP